MTDKVDARAVFDHASRFHYAATVLRIEAQVMTAPTLEPYVVVSSFCSELYMKCIYAMETAGARVEGHNLRRLFNALAPKTQNELSSGWNIISRIYNEVFDNSQNSINLPTNLVEELDISGRMFEEMRYFYEGTSSARHWYLSPFPDMLRKLILERQPQWAEGAQLISSPTEVEGLTDPSGAPLGRWSFIMYGIPRFESAAGDLKGDFP
jgi:hypothetical protein